MKSPTRLEGRSIRAITSDCTYIGVGGVPIWLEGRLWYVVEQAEVIQSTGKAPVGRKYRRVYVDPHELVFVHTTDGHDPEQSWWGVSRTILNRGVSSKGGVTHGTESGTA